MFHNMNKLYRGLSAIALSSSLLYPGCDSPRNEEILSGEIDGNKVRLVKEIRQRQIDEAVLEIYDSDGKLRAQVLISDRGFIFYDDGKKVYFDTPFWGTSLLRIDQVNNPVKKQTQP